MLAWIIFPNNYPLIGGLLVVFSVILGFFVFLRKEKTSKKTQIK
jgi:hypothetical protein